MRIHNLCDGKYTVHHDNGTLSALRHKEPFDLAGMQFSKLFLSTIQKIEDLEDIITEKDEKIAKLEAQLSKMETSK